MHLFILLFTTVNSVYIFVATFLNSPTSIALVEMFYHFSCYSVDSQFPFRSSLIFRLSEVVACLQMNPCDNGALIASNLPICLVRHPLLLAAVYILDDSRLVHGSVIDLQQSDDDSDSPPPESLRRIKEIAKAKMEEMKQKSKSYDGERSKQAQKNKSMVLKKHVSRPNRPRSGMFLLQN